VDRRRSISSESLGKRDQSDTEVLQFLQGGEQIGRRSSQRSSRQTRTTSMSRRPGLVEKEREKIPVFKEVGNCRPATGVRLDSLLLELRLEPGVEFPMIGSLCAR
jgi:hypothetical protein